MAGKRILIVGYGTAGKSLAESLKKHKEEVVGFLDDVKKGDKVLGELADVNNVLESHNVSDIYIAIPSASAKTIRNFLTHVEEESVKISIVPRSYDIISKETVNVHDLTDVDVLSLIGRNPVKHDLLQSKEQIEGKTVLVTGAAGSIGSKLVESLITLGAENVVCVDWWENGMFRLQQRLKDKDNVTYKIADIKNVKAIDRILTTYEPVIVFHAAAYKHVPLMQDNPLEAFNNNVWGSMNVMQLAIAHAVERFVLVSTDKAVNPVNVMGACKRLAEMTLESLAADSLKTKFTAVRFGNVIQSNGSVLEVFKQQIADNQDLTVTHKDITRFFMTIEEAAHLIIQSSSLGQDTETFVLDMGEPIKIYDLAESLIRLSDSSSQIKITGLRPGEKMYEELSYDNKSVDSTRHEKIFIVKGEKEFDKTKFITGLRDAIEQSLEYELTSQQMIDYIKSYGFGLKD